MFYRHVTARRMLSAVQKIHKQETRFFFNSMTRNFHHFVTIKIRDEGNNKAAVYEYFTNCSLFIIIIKTLQRIHANFKNTYSWMFSKVKY